MDHHGFSNRSVRAAGPGQRLWPVLALLTLAVLIPTACVVWFMTQAVGNERLAIRQRLVDVYRKQLETLQAGLREEWRGRVADLNAADPGSSPAERFASLVRTGRWDGAVIRGTSGEALYPSLQSRSVPPATSAEVGDDLLSIARQLETEERDYGAAAETYADIARTTTQPQQAARALQAQVRCLLSLGDRSAARDVTSRLLDPRYRDILDEQGRSIAGNAALLAIQLINDPQDPQHALARDLLLQLVNDYRGSPVPAGQRLFLMQQTRATVGASEFPTLGAEQLAAEFIEKSPKVLAGAIASRTGLPGVWMVSSEDGTVLGLLREDRIRSDAARAFASAGLPANSIAALQPLDRRAPADAFLTMPAGDPLPDWQLVLTLTGPDPFGTAAERRIAAHIWVSILVVLSTAAIAAAVARYVGRQVRLTRLKNDLIATVSHELKTPLSSIRALVDTLLERDGRDPVQSREYLELIARENTRLSRLIDNFLAFSRMERNRHAFEFAPCAPADLVRAAIDSVRERFEAAGARLLLDTDADLPGVTADADAMVTVLLNLLDNAFKYTGADKCIGLRAFADGDGVCFEVRDNGIGLSRRSVRRIFDRFYQVDQSLSRRTGGCGLGLSIVQFIVRAHGGTVQVRSQPGRGSTFTVRLPAVQLNRAEVKI